jgi:hypothetical protein
MPLLEIVPSKKITAIVTIEDATARQIDQYAAMVKGSADDVVQAALAHVFSKDKEFITYREQNPAAKPSIPLRIKRATNTPMKPADAASSNKTTTTAAR